MGTAVATPAPNMGALVGALKRKRQSGPSYSIKGFLKFGKDGQWTIGQANTNVTDQRVMFNTLSIEMGYVCWTTYNDRKNELLGEKTLLLTDGDVDLNTLDDHGFPWKPINKVAGRFLDSDMKGEEFSFGTSSYGGLKAMDGVLELIQERYASGEDAYVFPVVKLSSNSYQHAKWGKTYEPILDVVAWADLDGNLEGEVKARVPYRETESEAAPEAAPEPEAEAAPAPEAEAEAPVRRRR